MLIIFDFDSTLLHTRRTVADLFATLAEKTGIDYKTLEAAGKEAAPHGFGFTLEKYFKALDPHFRDEISKESANFHAKLIIGNASQYVFPGSSELLTALRARGDDLHLLSRGDYGFQMDKIDASGLADFFFRNYYCRRFQNSRTQANRLGPAPNDNRKRQPRRTS